MGFGRMQNKEIDILLENYEKKRDDIADRINYFSSIWEKDDKRIFSELCFCICTPQ